MGGRWSALDPRVRRVLLLLGTAEAVLKVVALVDLARRPRDQVRGPKVAWALGIVLANSAGVVPLLYLRRGRR